MVEWHGSVGRWWSLSGPALPQPVEESAKAALIGSHALKDLPGDGGEIDGRAETKLEAILFFLLLLSVGEARMITANPPRLAC